MPIVLTEQIIHELRASPLFENWEDDTVEHLSAGDELSLDANRTIAREGDPADHFYVILEGQIRVTRIVSGSEMVLNTYGAGEFFGEVPILMEKPFLATGQTVVPTRLYRMTSADFWNMLHACPIVLRVVLRVVASRMQVLMNVDQQQQKLLALGTLSAGLAHELNNPASAGQRASEQTRAALATLQEEERRLNAHCLPSVQQAVIDRWHEAAVAQARQADSLDPITQSEREQDLQEWLETQGIPEPWRLSSGLVSCGQDWDCLTALSARLSEAKIPLEVFEVVLCRFVAATTLDNLLTQVQESCLRISALVDTVKAYTFMDQAPIQQVDLHQGLDSTLTMLNYRLPKIEIRREFDPDLPRIVALGSELNQVWTSLITNAIEAMQGRGTITLHTACEGGNVLVEIIDDGPGIPPEIQERVFEPFFTTKDVGSGTGLGLDVSRRIVVGHHRGDIRFVTRPGETRFQVRLPLSPPRM